MWGKGKFSSWDYRTFKYLSSLGVDYLWLTGIPRHASGKDFVKGDPGCPYSISDWKDVNPYMEDKAGNGLREFELLVKRAHNSGIKIMIDFIPNHVARDYEGKMKRCGWHDGDWTDTDKNDWSATETFDEALDVLRFWASKGVDGFRCDMVELVPQEPQKRLIAGIREEFPGIIFVAEAYSAGNYGSLLEYVGYDLLYDKSGMYDSLIDIACHSVSARALTWNWQRLGGLQPRMLNFLENHDEVRIASAFALGAGIRAIPLLAASLLFNDASFMLYSAQEVGENAAESCNGRTSIFDWTRPVSLNHLYSYVHGKVSLDGDEMKLLCRYRDLLSLARKRVFREGRCWDLCYCNEGRPGFDADRHFCFLRFNSRSAWVVFCNFSDAPVSTEVLVPDEVPVFGGRTARLDIPAMDAVTVKL